MVCAKSQGLFVSRLPELKKTALCAFRHLARDRQDEAVQNALALCWKQYRALVLKGRADAGEMLTSILFYAIRQTRCGRTIQGTFGKKPKDAFEQRRWGKVQFEAIDLNDYVGRITPILDQVSFRMDVPKFLDTLTQRQRDLAFDLALGLTTKEVATKWGVTPAAVSQFRSRFKLLFERFFAVAAA